VSPEAAALAVAASAAAAPAPAATLAVPGLTVAAVAAEPVVAVDPTMIIVVDRHGPAW
jgi:ABC-type hemin transport system substrate-binding protein